MHSPPPSDAERFRALEHQVQELTERLARIEPVRRRPISGRVASALERRRAVRWAMRGEQWTGRVGLALLFLGLVFLYRYSIEQGWITPLVRVLFGATLGGGFMAIGLRVSPRRPSYGAILLAGAIASFYATGWAASYLYELLGRPIAIGWMAAVTVLALLMARRQEQPALASLGAIGGFATPFLLRPGSETVAEIVAYATLVVLWTGALYVERGWRSVLWTYLAGGTGVLAVAAASATGGERWLVQAALLIVWAAGAAYPFIHEARRSEAGDPRPSALIPFALQLRLLGAGGTAAVLAVTARMWSLGDVAAGALFLLTAALYGSFAWIGTRTPNFVARSAAPVAGAMLATGAFLVVGDGAMRWFAVAALGAVYLYGGSTERFRGLEWVGHGLFALAAAALLESSLADEGRAFGASSWAHLTGAAAGAAAAQFIPQRTVRLGYRAIAHVLLLVWMADQFADLSAASEWVTVAWGVYGAALLLLALELGRARARAMLRVQAFAASALALAVGKLLLLDLAQVSPLVRIPLFLGSGLALIGLSALFQRSVERGRGTAAPRPEEDDATRELAIRRASGKSG